MKNGPVFLMTLAFSFSTIAFACPRLDGKWSCFERRLRYSYELNFQVQEDHGTWHYVQTIKDDQGIRVSPERITDRVTRTRQQIINGNDHFDFTETSFCPADHVLQTHVDISTSTEDQVKQRSSADFILTLESDYVLTVITNGVDQYGNILKNQFKGLCDRE